MQGEVLLDSKKVQYSVRISRRAKHLLLHIGHKAELEVIVPHQRKIAKRRIERFIQEKKHWILKNLEKAEKILKKANRQKKFLLFLGRDVPIEVITEKRKRAFASPNTGRLTVKVPLGRETLAKKAIQQFYKTRARGILLHLAEKRAKMMNVSFSQISIRSQKTVWGSCSARRVLSFNWRLIAAPQEVVEYIVIHELAHLKHRNHSKEFWQTVQKYCPDYKKHEKWLKKNGDFIKARTDFE